MSEKQEKSQQIEPKPRKRLNLLLLCVSAFFSQACIFLYYGLIGPYASSALGAPDAIATLIAAVPALIGIFALVAVGILSDRSGRRKEIVMIGLVVAIIFNVLMALSTSWPELLIFRIIGGGIYTTTMFLYAVFFVFQMPEKRGLAVGLYMGLSTAGSAVFSIIGGALAQVYGGISGVPFTFWLGALLGLLSLVFLAPVGIPRYKAASVGAKGFGKAIATRGVSYPAIVFLVSGLGFIGFFSATPLIMADPLKYGATDAFLSSTTFIGLVFSLQSVVTAIGMFVGGALTDKIGPRLLMVIFGIVAGIALFAVPSLAFNSITLAVLVSVVTFFWALTYSAPPTSATASVEHTLAGTAVNTAIMIASIGAVLGGAFGGIFLGYGWQTAYYLMAVFLVVSGVIAIGVPKLKKPEKH